MCFLVAWQVLTFLKGFSDEERARLATFTFLVISTGLVTPNILTSLFHENLVEEETCGLSAFRHFPRTDCSGSDISSPSGVTLQGCAEACCADSTCLSFQYSIVNQCYLKSRLCSDGQKVSTSAGNMYDISGISLDFATALFKTWLSEKDFNSLISNLKKAGIEQRLPELFPANKRSPEHLESHFRAAGLGPIADYLKEQQNRANTKELKMELKKKLANGNDVKEIVLYVKDYMKKKKLAEHEVVVLVWSSVMKSVEWNKKDDLVAEQAIRLLKAYAPLLAALTTQGRSELDLLVAIQNYCYDNMQFMKVFHKILVLLYEADVLSKDTILKWHKDGHSPKGKSVFLEQTKEFVEQLQSAKEAREVEADADPENAFEAMRSSLLQEEAALSDREADKLRRSESEADFHGLVRLSELKAALVSETEDGPAAMERLNQISRELGEVWQAEEDPDVDDLHN
ncbi:basic leucine zipper and W2 domain-containing protein 1-like [Branchiostoma floridae]|uniref:Basic leucine zipper and W2 domain-containing protein 1-like n=1 Tax=Branchiostoma floridae TaxID=7739 RepID=A0A9J7KWV6_BRAFL|nr:basic leucine zipper and W2 domain-containing protein 1-like [Branchiostoma floridae]